MFRYLCCYLFCLPDKRIARLFLRCGCWCALRRVWRMARLVGLLRRCTAVRIRRSAVNRTLPSAAWERYDFMDDLAGSRFQLLGCYVFCVVCGFRLLCGVIQLVYEFLNHLALHNGWRGAPFGFLPCRIIFFSNDRYDVHLRNASHGEIYFCSASTIPSMIYSAQGSAIELPSAI